MRKNNYKKALGNDRKKISLRIRLLSTAMLILIAIMPQAFAEKTGVIVDVKGKVYSGCVNSKEGDSAYDVFKAFDAGNYDIDIDFTYDSSFGYYINSINGIKAQPSGDKYIYWVFWNYEKDDGFKISQIGASSYKISSPNEVIALNYASTNLAMDEASSEPAYISYEDLCEKLELKSVKIEVDGKKESSSIDGGNVKIKAGSKVDIEAVLENTYTDKISINAYIEAKTDSIDAGSDLDVDSDEKDIDAGREKKFTLSFTVPEDIDSDDYDMTLTISGTDDKGISYSKEILFNLEVDKEKHNIQFSDISLGPKTVGCYEKTNLNFNLLNTGENDESVNLYIYSADLGIEKSETLTIDEGDSNEKSYQFDIGKPKEGPYDITLKASYSGKTTTASSQLKVVECDNSNGAVQTSNQVGINHNTKSIGQSTGSVKTDPATGSFADANQGKGSQLILYNESKNRLEYYAVGIFFAAMLAAAVLVIVLLFKK